MVDGGAVGVMGGSVAAREGRTGVPVHGRTLELLQCSRPVGQGGRGSKWMICHEEAVMDGGAVGMGAGSKR